MFDLLDPKGVSSSSPTMDHYREWAGEIGNSYFNAGEEPTQTLIKIARQEELTPHQVEVLAGETNKTIHQAKFAKADEKYFAAEFPLANAKEAICALQLDGGGPQKVATAVNMEPQIPKDDFNAFEAFGIEEPEPMDKTASVKGEIKVASEKWELYKQKIDDALLLKKHAVEGTERSFVKQARQCLIDEPNPQARMNVLGSLYHFVKEANSKKGKELLAKVAIVAGKEGKLEPVDVRQAVDFLLEKAADNKAPQSWISQNLPARIINGQHPLYITLKTVDNRVAEVDRYARESDMVYDKLQIMRQRVRAL